MAAPNLTLTINEADKLKGVFYDGAGNALVPTIPLVFTSNDPLLVIGAMTGNDVVSVQAGPTPKNGIVVRWSSAEFPGKVGSVVVNLSDNVANGQVTTINSPVASAGATLGN